MLDKLRRRVDAALLFGEVLRTTRVGRGLHATGIPHFARGALLVKPGPHLAVMFHAATQPDKEAIVEYGERGVRRLTWRELDATINRLAHALAQRGVTGSAPVATMLPNGIEYLIAQQALARIGATAVQIGYRLKPPEIAYILGNAEPRVTIVDAAFLPAMRAARATTDHRRAVPMIVVGRIEDADASGDAVEWDRALAAAEPTLPPRVRDGDGGGVIVYTSGTTGKPKGASRSWKSTGFEAAADMMVQVGMRADDRQLVVCPLYHSAAPAFVAIAMVLGGTCVLMNHFEPEGALKIIEDERITCSMMVPTMIVRLNQLPPEVRAKYDTHTLRWVMSAAAPLSTEAARQFMAGYGKKLWNFYGSTETGLVTLAGPNDHVSRPGTIGRAMRGNRIKLLDDHGAEVPRGQIGEMYVKNGTMISGYHKDRAATDSASRDGYMSVGDLGRVDADGFYYLEARKHDMVISGGVNIYPREIEDHLHTHPAILEAAVIGVPDPEWGESLRAFVVKKPGAQLTEDEVIEFTRSALADYKRPRKVIFLPELPRNPTGKVLKRELRALAS